MAKKYINLTLKDYDENGYEHKVTFNYRLGPKAAQLFLDVANVEPTPENLEKLGVKGLVLLIYAGCKHQHNDLTVERIWDLVDNYELDELDQITRQIVPNDDNPNE